MTLISTLQMSEAILPFSSSYTLITTSTLLHVDWHTPPPHALIRQYSPLPLFSSSPS